MIFDAFIIRKSVIPTAILKKYNCKVDAIFIFSDAPVNEAEIELADGKLSIMGDSFSYSLMGDITRESLPSAELYIHHINKPLWDAQVKAYTSLYKSNIDREAILKECKDLPFLDDDSAIDFFIHEVTFSKTGGIVPIGLCLLDLSLNDMYSHLSVRKKVTL